MLFESSHTDMFARTGTAMIMSNAVTYKLYLNVWEHSVIQSSGPVPQAAPITHLTCNALICCSGVAPCLRASWRTCLKKAAETSRADQ